MRITDIRVDGFGIWSGLNLGDIGDGVTVVFGGNEAGKTTLMQYLRTMLYGLSPERTRRYHPPVHGGTLGGTLQLATPHGHVVLSRFWDTSRPLGSAEFRGRLTLEDDAGHVRPSVLLDQLLGGVDEPTFNNIFAVGLRELQELGSLDDTEAADLLYKLTTGLDRVSLVDVMQQLQQQRDGLLTDDPSGGQIVQLAERLAQCQHQAAQHGNSGRRWADLQHQVVHLDEELRETEAQIRHWEGETRRAELALQLRDQWLHRRGLHRQLQTLGPAPNVPERSLDQLKSLRSEIDERREVIAELRGRRRDIRREATAQPINRKLWASGARIEALAEHTDWVAALQSQIQQLQADAQVLQARLGDTPRRPLAADAALADLPDVPRNAVAQLRTPARALRDETLQLKQAQEERDLLQAQLEEQTVKLETTLLELGHEDLGAAVDATSSRASQLRRRLQVQQRLDEMVSRRKQLEAERFDLLDRQVLSPAALAWLGVPFVVGVALILGGLVWRDAGLLGWPVALLGLAGWAFAIAAKNMLERTAARELKETEHHLETLIRQVEQAKQEQEELDLRLPRAGGPLDLRLAESERQLAQLEDLLPLEANCQSLRQRHDVAQRRVDQLDHALNETRARWRQSLRRAGLPEDLSVGSVKQLALGVRETSQLQRQLEARRDELQARQRELTALALRIGELVEQVDLAVAADDPQVQLRQLTAALAEQKRLYQRRDTLRQEDRDLRKQGRQLAAELRRLQHRRRAIVSAAGVVTEKQLQQLIARHAKRQQLHAELAAVDKQLHVALGEHFTLQDLEQELAERSLEELQEWHRECCDQRHRFETRRVESLQHRGELLQEQKALVADRRLAEARLGGAAAEHQLHGATHRWVVLAAATRVLETVRDTVETHRQPETLREASRHFKALTDGQYTRIWTPLTEKSLRVDGADGQSLSIDLLSSGTREAVFLSLRLALVSDFARRGVHLPLVLDDVLVNFDLRRARAAARVLCDFAATGHQILLFTCHEHIAELFARSAADIRNLTQRGSRPTPAPAPPIPAPPIVGADNEPYRLEDPLPIAPAPATLQMDDEEPAFDEYSVAADAAQMDDTDLRLVDDGREYELAPALPIQLEPYDPLQDLLLDEPLPETREDASDAEDDQPEELTFVVDEPEERVDEDEPVADSWAEPDAHAVDEDITPPAELEQPQTPDWDAERRFAWESPERYHGGGAAA